MKNYISMEDQKHVFPYAKAPRKPENVTLFSFADCSYAQKLLALSLQGIRAKTCPDIFLLDDDPQIYEYFLYEQKCSGFAYREETDLKKLLQDHLEGVKGYILCDVSLAFSEVYNEEIVSNDSLNVATSLSGLLNGLICDQSEEALMQELGLPLLFDARDKDIHWLVESEFYPRFNKNIAFEVSHYEKWIAVTRDYMIMCGGICFFDEEDAHTPLREKILNDLVEDGPLFGWGNESKGENGFIEPMTRTGHYCVYALGSMNLSFHSAFYEEEVLKQKNKGDKTVKAENGNHYLTILVSDGDNVRYAFKGLRYKGRNYEDPAHGEVTLGWGLPTSLPILAPNVQKRLYESANDGTRPGKPGKDQFITYSAGGYFYPSMYPREMLEEHARKLNVSMKMSDTNIWGVIDFFQYNKEALPLWDIFTKQDQIDAIFYVDYTSYATDADYILWSNDKPVIASRARFWKDLPKSDIDYLANKFNNLPTDITNPNSYSLLMVHCWSRSIQEVSDLVSKLDEHVKVVDPETFVNLIKENVDRTYESRNNGKILDNKSLQAVLDTGDYWPELRECFENASIRREVQTSYPDTDTNAPLGLAVGSVYELHRGRYEAVLDNPITIHPDTDWAFGLKTWENRPGALTMELYGEDDALIYRYQTCVDRKDFKYEVCENLTQEDVMLHKVVFSSPDDMAFVLDECVFRGNELTPMYRRLLTDQETLHLTLGQSHEVKLQLTMTSFDEVNWSGAMFYTKREVDIEENAVYLLDTDDTDVIRVDGLTVTAVGKGTASLHCKTDHYRAINNKTIQVTVE